MKIIRNNFYKLISLVLFAAMALGTNAQDENFHIYLCFGQSNMNGSANFEAQDTTVNKRFMVLQAVDCAELNRVKAEWYTAVPPLCRCNSGLSPADYFGRTMVENLPEEIKIGVINVAVPGCDIRLFDKDIYKEYYKTDKEWFMNKVKEYNMNPYQHLIDLAKQAQKVGVIKGILLHQGETNAGQEEWPSYVKKINDDILTDLSLEAESVPLLAGEMVSVEDNCCAHMNPIINTLPDVISTAHIISSEGCTAKDKAHFDAAGYREMGRRYAAKMLFIQNRAESKLDFYGGWKAKKLQETGYFHVKHDGHRWWLVTPEGNAFLSFGINHYHEHWWAQDYNKDYWVKEFVAEKPMDKKWKEGFWKAAAHDLKRLGINTLGMHTTAILYTNNANKAPVPYIKPYKPIVLDHYRNPKSEAFVDVFSTEYEKLCDKTAKKVSENCVNDPMLLGYAMSDCPIFTDMDIQSLGTTSWSRVLPNLGVNAPGKKVYVELMQKHYAGIDAFNSNYNTKFSSWDDLVEAKNWRKNTSPKNNTEKRDDEAFTLLCVDRYYKVAKAAIKKYDSNHLFFGDKLNGNTDNLEKVLQVAAKYVDAIIYQFYGTLEQQSALLDKLTPKVSIPFVNGDIGFSSPSEMIPNPYGPQAKTQAQRADWLKESVMKCFVRPEFIGWHMCGVIDTWKTMPGKATFQHQGIMTVKGKFYPEMEKAVKEISSEMYQIANTK